MIHNAVVQVLPPDSDSWSPRQAQDWLASLPAGWSPGVGGVSDWLAIRWPWQMRVYDPELVPSMRRAWAAACVDCTDAMSERSGYEPWSAATDKANLRAYVISRLGEVAGSGLWEAGCLVRDVEAALVLSIAEAREMAGRWRSLPMPQILMLSRHKSLLSPLRLVIDLVQTNDPTVVDEWLAIRRQLP
jgi:hypothetical protein